MSNHWLKKNPFMSIWLSAANRMAGTMRGLAAAEIKRQVSTAATKAARDNLKALSDVPTPSSPKTKRRR